jgi:hypothetical protein
MYKYRILVFTACIFLTISLLSSCNVFDNADTSSENSSQNGQTAQTVQKFNTITITDADKKAGIDKFIGNWQDISNPSRFAVIQKTDIGYSYQDNEGTNPVDVKDGVLRIHITLDDSVATGEIDSSTGNLTVKYMGSITKFKKKKI